MFSVLPSFPLSLSLNDDFNMEIGGYSFFLFSSDFQRLSLIHIFYRFLFHFTPSKIVGLACKCFYYDLIEKDIFQMIHTRFGRNNTQTLVINSSSFFFCRSRFLLHIANIIWWLHHKVIRPNANLQVLFQAITLLGKLLLLWKTFDWFPNWSLVIIHFGCSQTVLKFHLICSFTLFKLNLFVLTVYFSSVFGLCSVYLLICIQIHREMQMRIGHTANDDEWCFSSSDDSLLSNVIWMLDEDFF